MLTIIFMPLTFYIMGKNVQKAIKIFKNIKKYILSNVHTFFRRKYLPSQKFPSQMFRMIRKGIFPNIRCDLYFTSFPPTLDILSYHAVHHTWHKINFLHKSLCSKLRPTQITTKNAQIQKYI